MKIEEQLDKIIAAKHKKDWQQLSDIMHPNIQWQFHHENELIITGIDECLYVMEKINDDNQLAFIEQKRLVSEEGKRIALHSINNQGIQKIDVYEFKDNKLYRLYEFML